jgi:hypothetical protein
MTFNGANATYFKGGLGVSIDGKTEADGGAEIEHKVMMMFPAVAAIGYDLMDTLSIEGEFSIRANYYDSKVLTNTIDVKSIAVNVVGNLPEDMMGAWGLYGGLGAAYSLYALGLGEDAEYAFGGQTFLGADYKLESNIRLGLEARYFTSVQDIEVGGVDLSYSQIAALFTAKFPF